MQDVCKIDLGNQVATVVDAMAGLESYTVMRDAACQVDQQTSAYCYVEATHNTNPADFYFYQLPLGISLPNTTIPSCNTCTQDLMNMYAPLASNGSLPDLVETYGDAATIARNTCGPDYVENVNVSSASKTLASSGVFGFVAMVLWEAVVLCAL